MILDVDCGPDDSHAILLFYYVQLLMKQKGEDIELLGITAVNGNTDVENVKDNIGLTLEVLKDIDPSLADQINKMKIFVGTSTPILMQDHKDYLFGKDGFSGFQSYYKNIYKDYG